MGKLKQYKTVINTAVKQYPIIVDIINLYLIYLEGSNLVRGNPIIKKRCLERLKILYRTFLHHLLLIIHTSKNTNIKKTKKNY
jgi:hypothetical protein